MHKYFKSYLVKVLIQCRNLLFQHGHLFLYEKYSKLGLYNSYL